MPSRQSAPSFLGALRFHADCCLQTSFLLFHFPASQISWNHHECCLRHFVCRFQTWCESLHFVLNLIFRCYGPLQIFWIPQIVYVQNLLASAAVQSVVLCLLACLRLLCVLSAVGEIVRSWPISSSHKCALHEVQQWQHRPQSELPSRRSTAFFHSPELSEPDQPHFHSPQREIECLRQWPTSRKRNIWGQSRDVEALWRFWRAAVVVLSVVRGWSASTSFLHQKINIIKLG